MASGTIGSNLKLSPNCSIYFYIAPNSYRSVAQDNWKKVTARRESSIIRGANHNWFGKPAWNAGKNLTQEHREKLSVAVKGVKSYRYDHQQHLFEHEDGRRIIGTKYELREKSKMLFGFSDRSLRNLIYGKCLFIKGW